MPITIQSKLPRIETTQIVKEAVVRPRKKRLSKISYALTFVDQIPRLQKHNINPFFLNFLIMKMNSENIVVLNKFWKDELIKQHGFSLPYIEKLIQKAKKANIIKCISTGTYFVNPHFWGKSNIATIQALQVQYDASENIKKKEDRHKNASIIFTDNV